MTVTDAVWILRWLFTGDAFGPSELPCPDAADVDDDGAITVSDAVALLGALFGRGDPPARPFSSCGPDPTDDALGCPSNERCYPTFCDFLVDGDAVVFVLDGSLNMAGTGEFLILTRETIDSVYRLRPDETFGIAIFDSGVSAFPATGSTVAAVADAKAAAVDFLYGWTMDSTGSCVGSALDAALRMAKAADGAKKQMFLVMAGGGTCEDADPAAYFEATLDAVADLNRGEATIHAVGERSPPAVLESFLQRLASENGGEYRRIDR